MQNLLIELQYSNREMEEIKPCDDPNNQTPNGTYIDIRAIMEETKNAELVEEKEKKLRSKSLIIYDVEHLLVTTRMALSKI